MRKGIFLYKNDKPKDCWISVPTGKNCLGGYMVAFKSFSVIESIMGKYDEAYGKEQLKFRRTIFMVTDRDHRMVAAHEFGLQVEMIKFALPYLKRLIINQVLPFFEDNSNSIEQLYEKVEQMPTVDEMRGFLAQPYTARRLILKAMVGAGDFEDYAQFLMERLAHSAKSTKSMQVLKFNEYLPKMVDELRAMHSEKKIGSKYQDFSVGPYE